MSTRFPPFSTTRDHHHFPHLWRFTLAFVLLFPRGEQLMQTLSYLLDAAAAQHFLERDLALQVSRHGRAHLKRHQRIQAQASQGDIVPDFGLLPTNNLEDNASNIGL
jgi:hypothetical protein